jgi:hypothetical protein
MLYCVDCEAKVRMNSGKRWIQKEDLEIEFNVFFGITLELKISMKRVFQYRC